MHMELAKTFDESLHAFELQGERISDYPHYLLSLKDKYYEQKKSQQS